jgi:glycerol-3-phosphate acyltransferase PlsY
MSPLARDCLKGLAGSFAGCLAGSFLGFALGFASGAIPFGVLVARWRGVDIQSRGSGNIGATNVARVLGVVPGLIVLVLDAAKGALPVAVAIHWSSDQAIAIATACGAILGHCFSPFLGFRGGKGVATSLGVFLVLAPSVAAVAVCVFAAVLAATRVPALGSLAGAAAIALVLVWRRDWSIAGFAVVTTLLLLYTHRSNLAKLRGRDRR